MALAALSLPTGLPLVLTVPIVWAVLQYVLGRLSMGGFPWYFLAHTQHDLLPMIQIADVTGVWGVTFVVAAVNAVLVEGLFQVPQVRRWLALANGAAAASVRSRSFCRVS